MLREAIEHHRQGRLEEAEKGYREELASHPDSSEALRGLGAVRRLRGDLAESASLFARAHELAPEQPKLLVMLGAIHLESGDIDASRDAYERALVLDPNLAGAHTALGHIAMMKGDGKLAEQYFRTALRVTEDPQALSGLGTLALDRGETEDALKYLTRAADLAPKDATIAYALGRGFSRRGMTAFAEQAFRNALRLRPGLPHANQALGQLLILEKRAAEAEPYFRELAGARGFELLAELGMGDAARMQEKHEQAVSAYQRALAINPAHEAGFEALIWSLGRLGRNEDLLRLLDQRISEYPEQPRWRATRARIRSTSPRPESALADWKWLHENNTGDVEAATGLARALERQGDFVEAARIADLATSLAPGDADLILLRARARLRDSDAAGARELLAGIAANTLKPETGRSFLNLQGQLHDQAGEVAAAVRCFREAQNGLPTSLPALEELPADLDAALQAPAGEAMKQAPVLLIGAPGSGVERVAALLSDQPGLHVVHDRVHGLRGDCLDPAAASLDLGQLGEVEIASHRETYLERLRQSGLDSDTPVIDWMPRFDARHLQIAQRILPGTRVVLVDRDARDALLGWLAFGWLPYAGLGHFDTCVDWLARAETHLRALSRFGGMPGLVVDAERLLADPAGAGAELAAFLGIDALVAGEYSARSERGPLGLPTRFADGHWQAYAEPLAEAFERLGN
jgi:tetratricopeptide (TPR) repeat protein